MATRSNSKTKAAGESAAKTATKKDAASEQLAAHKDTVVAALKAQRESISSDIARLGNDDEVAQRDLKSAQSKADAAREDLDETRERLARIDAALAELS